MAGDITGPLGGSGGGRELEAAARKQLAEAEAEARNAEKAAGEAEGGGKTARQRVRSAGNRIARERALTAEEIAKVEARIAEEEARLAREAIPGQGVTPTISQSKRDFQRRPNRVPDYLTNKGALNQRWEREFRAALQSGVQFTPSKYLPNDNPLRGLLADVGQAPAPIPPKVTYASNPAGRAAEAAARNAEQEAARTEEAEQKKTTAVQRGTRARSQARKAEGDVTKAVGGDLNEFNRIMGGRQEEALRQAKTAEEYQRRVAAGTAPAPGSADYQAQVARRQAELQAQEAMRSQALIPHPKDFGKRVPGPFGPTGPRDVERFAAGFTPGARSPLEAANREVARLTVAQQTSYNELQTAIRRAARAKGDEAVASAREVEDLQAKHQANVTATAAARQEVTAINREATARIQAAQAVREGSASYRPLRQQLDIATDRMKRSPLAAPYQPGTDIIPHPEKFGARVPGPFGPSDEERARYLSLQGDIEALRKPREMRRDPRQQAAAASQRKVLAEETVAQNEAIAAEERRVASLRTIATADQMAATAEAELTNAIRFHSAALGGMNGDLRRHGALTTEFISAAARGEASYREWGFQIGATAAKFAAWTLVSVPIIGALTAVRSLGKGAIDSASGVNVLKRSLDHVDAESAQRSFRQLAGQFNVPIGDTVEAIYRSSQVFHSQADAIDAAKAALYSYRVGEVDVADSTRYLNAIATGAGLTRFAGGGKQLLDLFNQINQAQNRFGINIRSTEAGMARAAGAFTNAGGSLSYLLALITTGSRVTGRTGENIGTALQRSVGFIQRPTNRARLREFGIDPTQGVESVYEQAFAAARHLQGPRLQKLATALSSPQYASYLVPILQNRQLFRQVQQQTSPQASQHSAENELNKVLGQIDERVKRLGTQLGQLGSNLAQSGLLNIFGALIVMLSRGLGAVNQMLEVFNQLPDAVRKTVTGLIVARGLLGAARRFNLGEALVGGRAERLTPYLVESQAAYSKRVVGKGIRAAATEVEDRTTKAQGAALDAALKAKQQTLIRQAALVRIDQELAAGAISEDEAIALREAASTKQLQALALSQEKSKAAAIAAVEGAEYRDLEASFQREVVKGRVPADVWAQRNNVYTPPVLANPSTMDPEQRRRILAGEDPVLTGEQLAAYQQQTRGPQRIGGTVRAAAQSVRKDAAAFSELQRSAGTMAASSAAMSATVGRAKSGWVRATNATEGVAVATRGFAASMLASFGPQGALIAALTLVPALVEHFRSQVAERNRRANTALQRARGLTPGGQQLQYRTQRGLDTYRNQLEQDQGDASQIANLTADSGPFAGVHRFASKIAGGSALQLRRLDAARGQQQHAIDTGTTAFDLNYDQLKGLLDKDFDDFNNGQITLKQLRERQGVRLAEIRSSLVSPQAAARLRSGYLTRLLQAQEQHASFTSLLTSGTVPTEQLDAMSEGLGALVQANVATPKQRTDYLQLQLKQAQESLYAKGPVGQKRLAEALPAITDTLQALGKEELDRALQVATSQAQRDAAYAKYRQTVTNAGQIAERALVRSYRLQAQEGRALNQKLTGPNSRILTGQTMDVNPIPDLMGQLGSNSLQLQLQGLTAQAPELMAQLLRGQAQTHNAARAISRVQRAFQKAMKPILDDIRNAARDSQANDAVQEQAALIQANAQLAAARAGSNQIAAQQAQIGGLQQLLAFQQAHRGTYKQSDIVSTMAQLAGAQNQLAQTAQQQARDLISAQGELEKSRTDNPLRQAQIDARTAQRQLAYGNFDTPAARLQAQAEANRTRRDAYKAASDRQIENLDLEHDIGKLSDQAFISALQRIYRTTKAGSEYKRQLRARILRLQHDIQNDTSLDINVGDLRLPTIYDVRRLARQGLNGPSVHQSNTYAISVRNDSDLEHLGGNLADIHGANVVAGMRSAGLR